MGTANRSSFCTSLAQYQPCLHHSWSVPVQVPPGFGATPHCALALHACAAYALVGCPPRRHHHGEHRASPRWATSRPVHSSQSVSRDGRAMLAQMLVWHHLGFASPCGRRHSLQNNRSYSPAAWYRPGSFSSSASRADHSRSRRQRNSGKSADGPDADPIRKQLPDGWRTSPRNMWSCIRSRSHPQPRHHLAACKSGRPGDLKHAEIIVDLLKKAIDHYRTFRSPRAESNLTVSNYII